MNYTAEQVANAIGGGISGNKELRVKQVLTDSRGIVSSPQSIFFAIEGTQHNGHNYIEELYKKGVRCFVVRYAPSDLPIDDNICFIFVANTLAALQRLAAFHRKNNDIPVCAITGSNGKTVVKEWLFQLLHTDKKIVRSPKSYNSQVGVPLSVLLMNSRKHDIAVFEAGISKNNEMEKLEKIIAPSFGIFTNIGDAHQENFVSLQEKISQKLLLFKNCDFLIYCADDSLIANEIAENENYRNLKSINWSFQKNDATLQIISFERKENETLLKAYYIEKEIFITIPFTDEASTRNCIHLWLLLLHLGFDNRFIANQILQLQPVAMRLDLRDGINNCTLINDSYNSDLTSLTIALDFLHQQKQNPQKMLILSDVQQSGKGESELYAEIAHIVSNQNINMFFGVGSALTKHKNKFSRNSKFFNTTESLLAHFQNNKYKNSTILIKGAREFRFERILHILEKKTHRTVLEINLNALVNNLNFFRSLLEKKTKIMAMVKAFSYGAGGFEIANVLAHHRVDYLAVAYIDEGVELRKAGVTLPIMVMNPETEFFDILIEYNLEPEIFNFEGLRLLYETARRNSEQKVNVHIKLDTGMKRLGFTDSDLIPLFNALNSYENIQIVSVFSHLATSDEVANDNFTLHQLNLFQRMSFAFLQNFNYPIMRHILNSAGIERFPNYQFEMVRLGIGLYGVCTEKKSELQEISSLKTHISQIKIVRAGETIGYGRKGKALLDTRIATIAIGYADGINRKLSNGNWKVIINGKKAPIIGNICMDMCMIDLSGIHANEGDEVIVFGKDNSICEMATKLETIPYEIMTGISRRVKKVYFHE